MMTMMISLLMKLQQEEESGLLVKSFLITLRSSHQGASLGSWPMERSSSTVWHCKTTTSWRGEQMRSTRRTSTPHVLIMMDTTSKRWGSRPSQTPPQVTPLWLACCFEAWDSALLLLSRGADPNKGARNRSGNVETPLCRTVPQFPLSWTTISNWVIAVCRSLLARGARLDLGGRHLIPHLSSSSSSRMSFGNEFNHELNTISVLLFTHKSSYKNVKASPTLQDLQLCTIIIFIKIIIDIIIASAWWTNISLEIHCILFGLSWYQLRERRAEGLCCAKSFVDARMHNVFMTWYYRKCLAGYRSHQSHPVLFGSTWYQRYQQHTREAARSSFLNSYRTVVH